SGEDYEANGRIVLNAGGPWADIVWGKLGIGGINKLRKTKGIHLLTRKISENALALIAHKDNRLFFVIPWEDYSLVGTTDTDYTGDLDNLYAGASDADYLVSELQHYFSGFSKSDVYYTFAGLRPLVAYEKKVESNTSRAHKLIDHEHKNKIKGFISILGGKITAYRAVAEEAIDMVCQKLNLGVPCSTAHTLLPGAPAVKADQMEKAARKDNLPMETVAHLAALYGSRFDSVLDYVRSDKRLGQPISSGCRDIIAQIKHSVEEEAAMTVSDFMLRRSPIGLGLSQGMDALETVAREMASLLGWSNTEKQKQIENYKISAALGQCFRK
ncbi:glycerol-3-phosphate dehydrogenase/oxidase, partial [Chloroflexota bacterium]